VKVVGVVGLPASGKGVFSEVCREMGIPVVVMGDVIRDAIRRAGLELNDANAGRVSRDLREKYGMAGVAWLTIPAVEGLDAPVVAIDGIRGDNEVRLFREYFPDFLLVGVVSTFENRLSRLQQRGRPDDTKTAEDLRVRDERELGWGLGRALDLVAATLTNDGSLEQFRGEIRTLLENLLEGCAE